MEPRTTPFEYVFASAARRETLVTLAANPVDRRTVVDRLEASESAVYDAFSGLAERGLIVRDGNRWAVTGTGRAVADCIERARRVDATLLENPAFWRAHDLACLPREIRTAVLVASERRISGGGGDLAPVDVLVAHLESERPETVRAIVLEEHQSLLETLGRVPDARVLRERPAGSDGRCDDRRRDATREESADPSLQVCAVESSPMPITTLVTDDAVAFALPALERRRGEDSVVLLRDETVWRRCRTEFDRSWRGARRPHAGEKAALEQ